MSEAIVTLKKGEGRMLKSGGLWIFDNEIASILGSFEDGDIVAVHDFDGYGLGKGFINRNSKIRVRMMTRNRHQEIDEAFLKMRVQEAWDYRKKVSDTGSCRVIFGEADFLPGLVVDKFSDVLVVQSLALGIDRLKDQIVELLKEVLAADGIKTRGVYERSDAKVRRQEAWSCTRDLSENRLIPTWRSKKTVSATWSMSKTDRKQDSSSIRNTTEKRSSISAKMQKCSTALPTPDPLP